DELLRGLLEEAVVAPEIAREEAHPRAQRGGSDDLVDEPIAPRKSQARPELTRIEDADDHRAAVRADGVQEVVHEGRAIRRGSIPGLLAARHEMRPGRVRGQARRKDA